MSTGGLTQPEWSLVTLYIPSSAFSEYKGNQSICINISKYYQQACSRPSVSKSHHYHIGKKIIRGATCSSTELGNKTFSRLRDSSIYLIDAVSDDGGPVDHGDLVHQLHFVPQRRVKHDGAQPDHEEGRVRRDEPLLEALFHKSELSLIRKISVMLLSYFGADL